MTIPTVSLSEEAKGKIRDYTRAIATELEVKGPLNIQYLVVNDSVEVIECNLRASRSLPFVSKATGVNLIELAASVILGGKLAGMKDVPEPKRFAVKAPQFSFMQMEGAEPTVGVEMRSTGEVACFGATLPEAMSRALMATGLKIPSAGDKGIFLADEEGDLADAKEILRGFRAAGISFVTTEALASALGGGAAVASVDSMLDMVGKGKAAMVLSLSTNLGKMNKDLHKVRRKAVELQVPFLTTVEEGEAVLLCVKSPLKNLS